MLAGYALLRRGSNLLWPIGWLVLASLVYYAWWRPEFLLLLLFSITVNFAFGTLIIDGGLSRTQSRALLTIGIVFNLCLLGYFKYAGFSVANVDSIFGLQWAVPSIVLPIGISFITFQKIAFLVDAHRGLVRNFTLLNYAFFVSFFPQLIAGPITHHSEIMPQIGPSQRRDLAADIAVGVSIFVVGLFKKVVIADHVAIVADQVFALPGMVQLNFTGAATATQSFTVQALDELTSAAMPVATDNRPKMFSTVNLPGGSTLTWISVRPTTSIALEKASTRRM